MNKYTMDAELPLEHCREYDSAAEHYARKGELPACMGSPGALDYIIADCAAFFVRVDDFRYALAMEKSASESNDPMDE